MANYYIGLWEASGLDIDLIYSDDHIAALEIDTEYQMFIACHEEDAPVVTKALEIERLHPRVG